MELLSAFEARKWYIIGREGLVNAFAMILQKYVVWIIERDREMKWRDWECSEKRIFTLSRDSSRVNRSRGQRWFIVFICSGRCKDHSVSTSCGCCSQSLWRSIGTCVTPVTEDHWEKPSEFAVLSQHNGDWIVYSMRWEQLPLADG